MTIARPDTPRIFIQVEHPRNRDFDFWNKTFHFVEDEIHRKHYKTICGALMSYSHSRSSETREDLAFSAELCLKSIPTLIVCLHRTCQFSPAFFDLLDTGFNDLQKHLKNLETTNPQKAEILKNWTLFPLLYGVVAAYTLEAEQLLSTEPHSEENRIRALVYQSQTQFYLRELEKLRPHYVPPLGEGISQQLHNVFKAIEEGSISFCHYNELKPLVTSVCADQIRHYQTAIEKDARAEHPSLDRTSSDEKEPLLATHPFSSDDQKKPPVTELFKNPPREGVRRRHPRIGDTETSLSLSPQRSPA